jgi:hypothetical protein
MPPNLVCEYEGCDCPKFEQRADQDPNKPFRCRDCEHVQNWHTSTDTLQDHADNATKQKVSQIMESFSAEIASLHQKPSSKASIADAEAECFAALKKGDNGEGHKKNSEKKKAKVGSHLILTLTIGSGLHAPNRIINLRPRVQTKQQVKQWGPSWTFEA